MNTFEYDFDHITENEKIIDMPYSQRMDLAVYELKNFFEKFKNTTPIFQDVL